MAKIKIKQQTIPDLEIDTIRVNESKETYITIHQDGLNVMVEHSKIVEFLKTVNTFK